MATTHGNVEKLPKWAQEYIQSLERERDTAVVELHAMLDNQTPSPYRETNLISDGVESVGPRAVTKYFQARNMEVDHKGVLLRIHLGKHGIELHWHISSGAICADVALIPTSFQAARLVAHENMTTR